MNKKVDAGKIKLVFFEAGCPGLVSFVQYLESLGEEPLYIHIPLNLPDVVFGEEGITNLKGVQIGGRRKADGHTQSPFEWCEDFANAIPWLSSESRAGLEEVRLIDDVLGKWVRGFESPLRPPSEEEVRRLNGEVA